MNTKCPNCGGEIKQVKLLAIDVMWRCSQCKAGFGQGPEPRKADGRSL